MAWCLERDLMKCRFFLAIPLTGAALVICASAFFENSHVPAAALTEDVTTPSVANDTPVLQDRTGGDWNPNTCHLTPETPETHALRPPVTPVSDVSQCPASVSEGDPNQCGPHCIVDISGSPVGGRAPEQILKEALLRCNTTIRLGPHVSLDYADKFKDLRPLRFARCVTLTSVNDFNRPSSAARTPQSFGPVLHYGDPEESQTFLSIGCNDRENVPPSDLVRISGFSIFGTTDDQQSGLAVGIRVHRCVDVEISNMEIHGFGTAAIRVENLFEDPSPRINDFSQVRIHDNFIHHNQHPSGGTADGYGVETEHGGARAHIYRNVFDFNRHAIAAAFDTGGYIAEENLVLKGGGWHGRTGGRYTHLFDVHGSGCWWDGDAHLCGNAGEEFHYYRNSFQYLMDNAIFIRGKPSVGAYITENVFPHDKDTAALCCGLTAWLTDTGYAVLLNTAENVKLEDNIKKTDTFGEYYSQCDFDGDGIDDLFLATGATWWYSSSGQFQWTFLNTSSKRKKDLKFGYFDDDDRCDIITESGSGRWLISSGGIAPWKPLEQVWRPQPLEGAWKPLKDVQFGRFDPNDQSHIRRTTHAFWREKHGEWWVKKLSDPDLDWEYIGGSHKPMSDLRFGDFTGDGVTDVLAVNSGAWAISESARKKWRPLNRSLNNPVKDKDLFIANMDPDDNIDDILRLEIQSKPAEGNSTFRNDKDVEVIWWRSKNGVDRWREFKRYSFKYPSLPPRGVGLVYPGFSFVGRFGAQSGGTLTIDEKRIGHFFSPGSAQVAPPEWTSRFPY
jgi:hypothetical protein